MHANKGTQEQSFYPVVKLIAKEGKSVILEMENSFYFDNEIGNGSYVPCVNG